MFYETSFSFSGIKGSDNRGIDLWMTKASKILIFFHSLKTDVKAQLELKSFGS